MRLKAAASRDEKRRVLYMDPDNFKIAEDDYGDALLIEFVNFLSGIDGIKIK